MNQSFSYRGGGCRVCITGVSLQSAEDSVAACGCGDRERDLIGQKESVVMHFELTGITANGKMPTSLEVFVGSNGHNFIHNS